MRIWNDTVILCDCETCELKWGILAALCPPWIPRTSLKFPQKWLVQQPFLNEGALFFGLFIACEKGEGDAQSSFISKPQFYPWSFRRSNELRLCKGYLRKYLENQVNSALSCDPADIATELSLSRSWIFCAQLSPWFVFFSRDYTSTSLFCISTKSQKCVKTWYHICLSTQLP